MPEIRLTTNGDITISVTGKRPEVAERLEGLGSNLDGRMFVDDASGIGKDEPKSLADNFPHGISPADL